MTPGQEEIVKILKELGVYNIRITKLGTKRSIAIRKFEAISKLCCHRDPRGYCHDYGGRRGQNCAHHNCGLRED